MNSLTDKEVIILASDGLWDVLTNNEVANITRSALLHNDEDDFSKFVLSKLIYKKDILQIYVGCSRISCCSKR